MRLDMLTNVQVNSISVSMCPYDMFPIDERWVCSSSFDSSVPKLRKVVEIPPGEFAFEDSVRELIGNANLRIESAKTGVNSVPILLNGDTNERIAVFKEYSSFWTTVNWGDLLAYKLDHNSFANVPVAFRLTSLSENVPQKFLSGVFVKWISNAREMTATEQIYLSSEQRQAIAILDMRLGNNDRNVGNVLVGADESLFPIDHDKTFSSYKPYPGACFRDQPISENGINYILALDVNQDVAILREFGVEENEISNYVIRTIFLKLAAEESCQSDITLGQVEDTIEYITLPSGKVGVFIDSWLYQHPLKKILNQYHEPYDENLLKEAFRENFNYYLRTVQNKISSYFQGRIRGLYC